MVIMNQDIPDHIIDKFNQISMLKFGYMKGSKKKALVEALKEWIRQNER